MGKPGQGRASYSYDSLKALQRVRGGRRRGGRKSSGSPYLEGGPAGGGAASSR